MEATQCLGKGYHVRQRPDSQSHTYISIPIHSSSVTGLKIVLALSSGLVKLSHSCWTFPDENHRQVGGKGCSSKPSVTAYYGFFILLRGLFGDFGTATAVLQGQGKHREKQYMLYPGTRKKISLHLIDGSHPL